MKNQDTSKILNDLVLLLEAHNVQFWFNKIKALRDEYVDATQNNRPQDEQIVLAEIEDLFGGMGSFNDYTITHLHGDSIEAQREEKVNEHFNGLRHQLAESITQ